ncbi:hypothetical protein BGZ73_001962 [Actinomortierella ambigua]|nr:hypothetical protein BGZ73_001962 [Actinomortierella ambigua]
MVLVQMPTRDLAKSYHTHILRPHLIHYPPLKDYHLHSHEITTDLQSPEMSLRGSIIVWRDETADRIRPFLDLAMPCQPPVEPSLSTSKSSTASGNSSTVPPPCLPPSLGPSTISEETLASLLDYPGRLPQSYLEFPTMLEVSYWDDDGPTLLTAFAAQKDQLELVRLHFAFYRNAMLQHLDIRLKLQVLDMATQALK